MFAGLLKIFVTLYLCLLARVVQATETECLDHFNPQPTDVIVPEGDVRGVFKCHYCKADNVGWLWNGSPIDENAYRSVEGNITVGSTFSDGRERKSLTVLALPGFNGTAVQCYASLGNGSIVYSEPAAHFCVIEPPGPIKNLIVEYFPTYMSLFWEQPPNTTPFPICLCIEVFSDAFDVPLFLQGQCDLPVDQSPYPIIVDVPNPKVQYIMVVIPRYNETGAKNGTSSRVTGFILGKPVELPDDSMVVLVNISMQRVSMVIEVDNAQNWNTSDGRRVHDFFVKVLLDEKSWLCHLHSISIDHTTITLPLDCTDLPREAHGTVLLTAANKAGSVTLSSQFSTHYIQHVRYSHCDGATRPHECQIKVTYDLTLGVDSQTTKGALAVLLDQDKIFNCFVGNNDGDGAGGVILVSELKENHNYSLLVFTLDSDSFPSMGPVNLPIEISNVATDGVYVDPRRVHLKDVVQIPSDSDDICLKCYFQPDSPASHCAPLLFLLNDTDFQKTQIVFGLFERRGDRDRVCLKVEKRSLYSLVVFGYINGHIEGSPFIFGEIQVKSESEHPIAAIVVPIIACLVIFAVVLVLCWVYYRNQSKKAYEGSLELGKQNSSGCGDSDTPMAVRVEAVKLAKENTSQNESVKKVSDSGIDTGSVDPQDDVVVIEETGVRFTEASQCVGEDKKSEVPVVAKLNSHKMYREDDLDRKIIQQATTEPDDDESYNIKVRHSLPQNQEQQPEKDKQVEVSIKVKDVYEVDQSVGNMTSPVASFRAVAGDGQ